MERRRKKGVVQEVEGGEEVGDHGVKHTVRIYHPTNTIILKWKGRKGGGEKEGNS